MTRSQHAAVPLLLGIPLGYFVVVRRERIVIDPLLPLGILFLCIQLLAALFAQNRDTGRGPLA